MSSSNNEIILPPEYSWLPAPIPVPKENAQPSGLLLALYNTQVNAAYDFFNVLKDAGLSQARLLIDAESRRVKAEIRAIDGSLLAIGMGIEQAYVIALGRKYYAIEARPTRGLAVTIAATVPIHIFTMYISAAADKMAPGMFQLPAPLPVLIDAFAGSNLPKRLVQMIPEEIQPIIPPITPPQPSPPIIIPP